MKLYRFSPIATEAELKEAISYLIEQEVRLATKTVGDFLPITYLTIFAHYDDEYDRLVKIMQSWGEVSKANNGVKAKLCSAIQEQGQDVKELRIRKPDPYRMQVGCCDFGVNDYYAFKEDHLAKNPHLRLIKRPDYEMLEFFDPDFDVLAYVVSP